jgi:hypothetical protein
MDLDKELKDRQERRSRTANPPEVFSGVDRRKKDMVIPGPAAVYGTPAGAQVPKTQVLKDLGDLLRSMPLTDSQTEELFTIIVQRLRHSTCAQCGRVRPRVMGQLETHPSGDMLKPKVFLCDRCCHA